MKSAAYFTVGLCVAMLPLVHALPGGAAQAPPQARALVIEGGTLIDGNGGPPVRDAQIIVRDDRIARVGRKGQAAHPAGARVIRADGKFIVPGLIDAKSNYASNHGEAYIVWGVTSAIWSGGGGDAGTAERDAINHGMLTGPRLFVSYAGISGPGPDGRRQDNGIPGRYPHVVRTPHEARALAIRFFEAGADFISAGDGDGPPALFAAIVDEAHTRGKAAVMRTVGPATAAREAAMMGSDVLIHTGQAGVQIAKDSERWKDYVALPPDPYADMDDAKATQMIKLLVEHRTALEPDLIATSRGFPKNWARVQHENATFFTDKALLAYFPLIQMKGYIENAKSPETYLTPAQRELRARGFRNHVAFLKRFVDAGGRIVPASDIPQSPPGLGLHQEMAVFQEDVGLTPMQALQSATQWASEAFKLKDLGTIEVGKRADLIIVNADPTVDILNLRKIDAVIKDGQVQDRTYHASYLDKSFKAGLYKGGSCCFSSPVIEGAAWVAAMKQATWRPASLNGGFQAAGGLDSEISPPPGIESIMPYVVNQGSPTTTVTLKGFNFVRGSRVYLDNHPVPTTVVSRSELQATIDATILAKAAKYALTVKNPPPIAPFEWGDTSNQANLLVPYTFTTKHSQNKL